MAQIRLRDYHEPLTSFYHNLINLLIHGPGRFGGFDTLVKTDTLQFKITHQGTNYTYKNELGDTVGPLGVLMTTQGVIVLEPGDLQDDNNAQILFNIDTNSGNPYDRVDILVCSHQFVNIDGGQTATYSIIKGAINDPASTPPSLTDPYFQTLIGSIYIPAGATDINQCTYTPALAPDSGDGRDARISTVNRFESLQQLAVSSTEYTDPANIQASLKGYDFKEDGNTLIVRPPATQFMDAVRFGINRPVQDGAEINILISDKVAIREDMPIQPSDLVKGYSTFILGQFNNAINVFGGVNKRALNPKVGENWLIKCTKVLSQWWVTQVVGSSWGNGFVKGMSIALQLTLDEILTLFDDTGLGKSGWAVGWAIENGQNETIDKTARFALGSNEVPGGNTNPLVTDDFIYHMGELDGSPKIFLTPGQLPRITPQTQFSTDQGGNRFGSVWLKNDGTSYTRNGIPFGNDESHENRPPWFVTCWIMKL